MTSLQESYELDWQTVEIANNDDLINQYGTRIPVIQNINNKAELAWPFNRESILDFIMQN